jgi:hypothetical protein
MPRLFLRGEGAARTGAGAGGGAGADVVARDSDARGRLKRVDEEEEGRAVGTMRRAGLGALVAAAAAAVAAAAGTGLDVVSRNSRESQFGLENFLELTFSRDFSREKTGFFFLETQTCLEKILGLCVGTVVYS